MEKDLEAKIKAILEKGSNISEDEVRSLMVLIRKRLELMVDSEKEKYLVLNLFCNWCAHTKIDKSNTGLRIIARVNDALVAAKDSNDTQEIQLRISKAMGYVSLRKEMALFLKNIGLMGCLKVENIENDLWFHFLDYLFEIIRDVPIAFPSLGSLDKNKQKIYNQIALNAIGPGGGVVSMKIIKIDYSKTGAKDAGEWLSLHIKLENTTNIIIPLLLDVNLT